MTHNPIEITLKETGFYNNPSARPIIRKKLSGMIKYPSEFKARDLEELGLSVDYQNSDAGEAPALIN